MVQESVLETFGHAIMNAWIAFRTYPSSDVKTLRLFRLKLIEELVQPLLSMHLHIVGRQTALLASRLVGKHFPYKSSSLATEMHCL